MEPATTAIISPADRRDQPWSLWRTRTHEAMQGLCTDFCTVSREESPDVGCVPLVRPLLFGASLKVRKLPLFFQAEATRAPTELPKWICMNYSEFACTRTILLLIKQAVLLGKYSNYGDFLCLLSPNMTLTWGPYCTYNTSAADNALIVAIARQDAGVSEQEDFVCLMHTTWTQHTLVSVRSKPCLRPK